jgi:hypothetical protein
MTTNNGLLHLRQRHPGCCLQAQGVGKRIEIPSSVPGLTTQRLLVMSYIDGLQVTPVF